jgi:hypothetical protein
MTTTTILNFYGVDWLAMALSLLAVWLLGNKNQLGFLVFIAANALWIVLGLTMIHSYGIVFGNLFFLVSNFRGYLKWMKQVD